MSLLVPFDGSKLATKALERADAFGDLLDEAVIVLTVIPDDAEYARERGWITQGEPFDPDAIATGMQTRAEEVAPEATVRIERVSSDEPTATSTTNVVREIRRIAGEIEASVVFIGSENAGRSSRPSRASGARSRTTTDTMSTSFANPVTRSIPRRWPISIRPRTISDRPEERHLEQRDRDPYTARRLGGTFIPLTDYRSDDTWSNGTGRIETRPH